MRLGLVLFTFSLVAAACGGDTATETQPSAQVTSSTASPTTTAAPSTTTTTTIPTPPRTTTTTIPTPPRTTTTTIPPREYEPTLISYRYPSDDEVEYIISIEQEAEITLEGGVEEEMPPGPIVTATTLEGTISYQTSPGPEENTTTIRIISNIEVIENQMSMGGITIPTPPDAETPGLNTAIDITLVVDEQGNILEVSSDALGDISQLLGDDSLFPTDLMGSQQMDQPYGPVFPDYPLEVGDTWTERTEEEGPAGMGTIVTTAEHHLVEVETRAGRHILVLESEYRTEAFEWDMSEFLQVMFGAFGEDPEEPSAEDVPPGPEGLSEVTMVIGMAPSTTMEVTRFDVDAGLVIEGEYRVSGGATTNMAFPDENGDTNPIISTTTFEQTGAYRLVSPVA